MRPPPLAGGCSGMNRTLDEVKSRRRTCLEPTVLHSVSSSTATPYHASSVGWGRDSDGPRPALREFVSESLPARDDGSPVPREKPVTCDSRVFVSKGPIKTTKASVTLRRGKRRPPSPRDTLSSRRGSTDTRT